MAQKRLPRDLAPPVREEGDLDGALHPMHQTLLERWQQTEIEEQRKYSPRARLAILVVAGVVAWGAVVAIVAGVILLV